MKHALFLCAAITVLSGCSHYSEDLSALDRQMDAPQAVAMTASPQDIAPAAGGVQGTRALSQYLAREYYTMAKAENTKAYDYKTSKLFTKKAVMASKGQTVMPSKVSSYDIPANLVPELTAARADLIAALKDSNTPDNAQNLATAQTRYECWLEQAEEATKESHYAACKAEFEQAMATLVTPAAGGAQGGSYDIGFGANTAIIDPAQSKTLEMIAQFLKAPASAAYTATLTGFTPAQGEFAASLTNTRVEAVRRVLLEKGVEAARLNPLIAPAGEAGAQGGKVQVTLIPPVGGDTGNPNVTTKFVPVTPEIVSDTAEPPVYPAR